MTLGKRIGRYRKKLGLTQEALAQKLDVTNQAVSKWDTREERRRNSSGNSYLIRTRGRGS